MRGLNTLESVDSHSEDEPLTDEQRLEELFQGLWDRVKRAGDLISSLRSENVALGGRVGELEAQLRSAQKELTEHKKELLGKDELIRGFAERESAEANNGKILSNGEREAIAAKAKELLERIQGYL